MAQFDTIMYGQLQPVKIQSPFELQAQFDELQRAKNQNRLAQMQFDESGRADKERNALADLSRQYGNSPDYAQELMRAGYGPQAGAQLKAEADRRKIDAEGRQHGVQGDKISGEIDAQRAQITKEQHAEAIQKLGAIRKNPNRSKGMMAEEINSEIQQGKIKPEQAAPLLDKIGQLPDGVRALDAFLDQITTAMQTAQQQQEAVAKQKDYNYRAQNDTASRALTQRGQDMTYASSQEKNAIEKEQVRLNGGYGKLTEQQGKGNLFGTRAVAADKILTQLEGKISTTGLAIKQGAEKIWGIGGALGAAGNTMLSPDQQKIEQAQRDFVYAVLRPESGAVVSEGEFENARKQYFPQPGDSEEVIRQKRDNRKTEIAGLGVIAGPAGQEIRASAQAQQPQPPQAQGYEQTATNPKTGQKIGLRGGVWVPIK